MTFHKIFLSLFITSSILFLSSFNWVEKNDSDPFYFPPLVGNEWETKSMESLGWNQQALQPLKSYLKNKNTKSFMILVNGKIVLEEYFDGHNASSIWQWNSAGKTLTSATIGIAQQEGKLNINNKVSDYLGKGWTREPLEKENLITVKNLLTMTSGINDSRQIIAKFTLKHKADAGTRWSYHNVFQKLMDIVKKSTSSADYDAYFNAKLKNKIGMDGYWKNKLMFSIYHSSARSMARFGLLALNKGKWNNEQIVDEQYFNESISSSQSINPAYGYLWWLNGKKNYMVPSGQKVYSGSLIPNAPSDMYAAMGYADQRLYVIPSKNMVIVRMGKASNPVNHNFAVSGFDNELWAKINALIEIKPF